MTRDRRLAATRTQPTARGTPRTPPARGLTAVAVRVLPAGDVRERYRREFAAEQCVMTTPLAQTKHALGVLLTSGALRAALAGPGRTSATETLMAAAVPRKPILCRLNLYHRWRRQHTEDGGRYLECVRCRKVWTDGPQGHIPVV